jgi:hypothetical protein
VPENGAAFPGASLVCEHRHAQATCAERRLKSPRRPVAPGAARVRAVSYSGLRGLSICAIARPTGGGSPASDDDERGRTEIAGSWRTGASGLRGQPEWPQPILHLLGSQV